MRTAIRFAERDLLTLASTIEIFHSRVPDATVPAEVHQQDLPGIRTRCFDLGIRGCGGTATRCRDVGIAFGSGGQDAVGGDARNVRSIGGPCGSALFTYTPDGMLASALSWIVVPGERVVELPTIRRSENAGNPLSGGVGALGVTGPHAARMAVRKKANGHENLGPATEFLYHGLTLTSWRRNSGLRSSSPTTRESAARRPQRASSNSP